VKAVTSGPLGGAPRRRSVDRAGERRHSQSMRAVLFDLDQTLVRTARLYQEAYTLAFRDEAVAWPSEETLRRHAPTSEKRFLRTVFGQELGARIHQRMLSHYTARAAELCGGFFDDVPDVLDMLEARGFRLGIVTGKSREAYEVTRQLLPDLERFEVVVVEDDVDDPKPHPAGVQMALRRLGVGADETVFAGDMPTDVEAGRRAGVATAAVLYHKQPQDRPTLSARYPAEVWRLHRPGDLVCRLEALAN
jgi:pyrophosphatase PpaX